MKTSIILASFIALASCATLGQKTKVGEKVMFCASRSGLATYPLNSVTEDNFADLEGNDMGSILSTCSSGSCVLLAPDNCMVIQKTKEQKVK